MNSFAAKPLKAYVFLSAEVLDFLMNLNWQMDQHVLQTVVFRLWLFKVGFLQCKPHNAGRYFSCALAFKDAIKLGF